LGLSPGTKKKNLRLTQTALDCKLKQNLAQLSFKDHKLIKQLVTKIQALTIKHIKLDLLIITMALQLTNLNKYSLACNKKMTHFNL
jgi:hypothetical protein